MNKRPKNISRILLAAVTAMMLLFMTAAGAWAEGTQEPPKILWFYDKELEKQWTEIMGLSEPLKSLDSEVNHA